MIRIIRQTISKSELDSLAKDVFGDMVKGVVDVKREVLALGGELHADEEAILLQDGSEQRDLWGINIYPARPFEKVIEFDSMINIRPSEGNYSRDIQNPDVRGNIKVLVHKLIPDL